MARPWEYTPMRRRMMQVVLCGVLALSTLLAWLVVRQHHKILVPTQWQTKTFAGYSVQVPAGWRISVERDGRDTRAKLDEPHPYLLSERSLLLVQRRLRSYVTPEELAADLEERAQPEMLQPLDFLGQKGFLVQVPQEEVIEGQTARMYAPRLFAVAVFPTRYAIVIELRGPHHFTSADIDLLKTVAKSMKQAV